MPYTGKLKELSLKDIKNYLLREKVSYWGILFYLFIEYLRPQTLYPALDIIPWGKVVLISLPVIFFLIEGRSYNVSNVENKLIVIYFVVIVLSSFFAISFGTAQYAWIEFLIWMHVYFLIVNIVNTENRFLIFMLSFLLYNVKMAQFSVRGWASVGFGYANNGTGGGPGYFQNSGELGIEMCIFFPISLYFVIGLKRYWPWWKKYLSYFMPLLGFFSIVSTNSRGAMLGFGVILLWILIRSKHRLKAFIGIVVVTMVFLLILPDKTRARFENSGDDRTSIVRLDRWKKGIAMANMYPLLGVGYNNERLGYTSLFSDLMPGTLLCHNIFIQCMAELGYTGLLVFVLMIMFTLVNNYQTRKFAKKDIENNYFIYNMAYGLDGALIGFITSGFFVTVLYYPYFWINIAMTVSLNNIMRIKAKKKIKYNSKHIYKRI